MPRRDTMHLRNDRVLRPLVLLVFLCTGSWAIGQNSGQSTVPPPNPAPSTASPETSAPPEQAPSTPRSIGQQQAPARSSVGAGSTPSQPPAPIAPKPGATQQEPSSTPQQASPNGQQPPASEQPGTAAGQERPGQQSQPGQQPENEGGAFVFKKEVEEVILHATVLDEKQRMVTNLDRGAFTILENNQPQTIKTFRHEDIPVALGIVIDNSGSMREKRDRVNQAAINLVRASNKDDQVFIVKLNDEYTLFRSYTSDIKKLQEGLEKVEARGGTALYDALVASADHLKKSAKLQKKVLLVVTDGEDNASRESLEQAVHRVSEENGPTVYAIGDRKS